MIHIRIDEEELNSRRKFACGLGPELPPGDTYYFPGDALAYVKADCPGCNPHQEQLGTPLSQLTYARFVQIARSWGYD